MIKNLHKSLPALTFGLLLAAGCGVEHSETVALPPESARPSRDPDAVVTVGGVDLTVQDFEFARERMLRSGTGDGSVDAVLDGMVERELMVQAARDSEVAQDPEIQREIENLLLSRWIERTLREKQRAITLEDAAVKDAYEQRVDEFTQPALSRLAILFRKCDAGSSPETAQAITAELTAARDRYLKDPDGARQGGRMKGFGLIAADVSEDAVSRYRGGDIGWLDRQKEYPRWPKPVLKTGFSLGVGEVSDVLRTDEGLYVVMKAAEREAQLIPLAQAAASLRRDLLNQRRETVRKDFMQRLRSESKIEIHESRLGKLRESLKLASRADVGGKPQLRPMSMVTPSAESAQR